MIVRGGIVQFTSILLLVARHLRACLRIHWSFRTLSGRAWSWFHGCVTRLFVGSSRGSEYLCLVLVPWPSCVATTSSTLGMTGAPTSDKYFGSIVSSRRERASLRNARSVRVPNMRSVLFGKHLSRPCGHPVRIIFFRSPRALGCRLRQLLQALPFGAGSRPFFRYSLRVGVSMTTTSSTLDHNGHAEFGQAGLAPSCWASIRIPVCLASFSVLLFG
ncbi:hypothetical protein F5888DRAFT_1663149 [Russula emetica]|nr:hypothetical protein F5888DRAFT_1663149 [Russula emetica]